MDFKAIIIGLLFLSLITACQTKPLNEDNMIFGTIGIVSYQSSPIIKERDATIEEENMSVYRNNVHLGKSLGVGAFTALEGAGYGAIHSIQCGPLIFFCLPAFTAIGAVVGFTGGAVLSIVDDVIKIESNDNHQTSNDHSVEEIQISQIMQDIDREDISAAVSRFIIEMHTILPKQVMQVAESNTNHSMVYSPVDNSSNQGIDTILEVGINSIEVVKKKNGELIFFFETHGKLIRAMDGYVIRQANYTYISESQNPLVWVDLRNQTIDYDPPNSLAQEIVSDLL